MSEEFYPMPLFVRMFVRDVAVSAQWYANAFGFRSVYALSDVNGRQTMNHIRLAKYQDLMLLAQPQDTTDEPSSRLSLSFSYDGSLGALAQRALSAGATVGGPTVMPYNAYELTVIDPNGFILIFSQLINVDRPIADIRSSINP
ncbi:MAG TPA: VOC family protein [Coleofasciculaceae cyanobacterium]